MTICLCVCLSVSSHVTKTTCPISPNFLYMLPMAVARSLSDSNAIRYVYFWLVDDVIFYT